MKTAKEYFKQEYGEKHIETVMQCDDDESMYGLIEEYADFKLKESLKIIPNGDDIWVRASENSRFNFEEWYDDLISNI